MISNTGPAKHICFGEEIENGSPGDHISSQIRQVLGTSIVPLNFSSIWSIISWIGPKFSAGIFGRVLLVDLLRTQNLWIRMQKVFSLNNEKFQTRSLVVVVLVGLVLVVVVVVVVVGKMFWILSSVSFISRSRSEMFSNNPIFEIFLNISNVMILRIMI